MATHKLHVTAKENTNGYTLLNGLVIRQGTVLEVEYTPEISRAIRLGNLVITKDPTIKESKKKAVDSANKSSKKKQTKKESE
jgi:hypothetical protein